MIVIEVTTLSVVAIDMLIGQSDFPSSLSPSNR